MFELLNKNLDAFIQELTECLDFISASSALRPRLREFINWDAAKGPPQQLITNFLDRKGVRDRLIYRALYVSGHAAFEQFARDIVAEAADYISSSVGPYNSLWEEIRKEHIFRTGQAMETIHQPLEHYAFDYHQLSTNIGSCIPGRPSFRLNSDALALIRGTLTPDNLEKLIKRLSVPFNWDSLASYQPLKTRFQARGTREVANEIRVFLEDMVKNRNRIAHSTGVAAEIGEGQVREQLEFVQAFCHALSTSVKVEMVRKVRFIRKVCT